MSYQAIGALPDWLKQVAGAVVRGTTVTIPTPAGPVVVDLGNPQSVAAAKAAVTGAKISVTAGTKPTTLPERINAGVTGNIPGGWATIAAAVAALVFLPRFLRARG
jgi:hypothetical protein